MQFGVYTEGGDTFRVGDFGQPPVPLGVLDIGKKFFWNLVEKCCSYSLHVKSAEHLC